ncbi:MAG: NAD(P)H-dependent glycerol-3-phosphate dehydrogenase [Acetobacteraceae bacterium]
MSRVAVIGAGAWGSALAIQAARAGNEVLLWARNPDTARAMQSGRLSPRLPGASLPDAVQVVSDLPEAADLTLMVVPMQYMRGVLACLPTSIRDIVVCAKGVETRTHRLPLEVLAEFRPDSPGAVLTGPNFAHEVAAGLPAASVVASADSALREHVAATIGTPAFRIYGNDDPIGAQLGGAAKNVIAIAAGAVIGAGLGENARAALITRGLAELARLATVLGGRPDTMTGLSGLGDLLLTCTGTSSRNYSLGLALGQGQTLAEILAQRSAVTEGVATAPALVARAMGAELPICAAVAELVEGRTTLAQAIADLLARPRREERDSPAERT